MRSREGCRIFLLGTFASYGLSFIAVILLAILGKQLQDFRMCDFNKERGLSKCCKLESERSSIGGRLESEAKQRFKRISYSRELFFFPPEKLNSVLSHSEHEFLRIENS